ncbi:MAG: hypothetical protein P8X96_22755 [Desulfobacteraceae bacterium]|jgi:hypothetical protein
MGKNVSTPQQFCWPPSCKIVALQETNAYLVRIKDIALKAAISFAFSSGMADAMAWSNPHRRKEKN